MANSAANQPGEAPVVAAAVRSGSGARFAELAEAHRGELLAHCYHLLGSRHDAEDMVQETLVRAWANRARFEGRSTFRAWLYRIATNACLDTIKRRHRQAPPIDRRDPRPAYDKLPWLQPMPRRARPAESEPEAAIVGQETVELIVLAAIQHLSPRQRAALVLRDLLAWTPTEIADAFNDSPAAVNSLLQRARRRLNQLGEPATITRPAAPPTLQQRALLQRYIEAHANADASAVLTLLDIDVRLAMPPYESCYVGRHAVASFFHRLFGPDGPGEFRLLATEANGQLAAVNYLRRPGRSDFDPITIDVLGFGDLSIIDIVTFDAEAVDAFGLPTLLQPEPPG